jgi:hypothetical protein
MNPPATRRDCFRWLAGATLGTCFVFAPPSRRWRAKLAQAEGRHLSRAASPGVSGLSVCLVPPAARRREPPPWRAAVHRIGPAPPWRASAVGGERMRLAELGLSMRDVDLGSIDAESDHKLDEYFVTTPYVTSALGGRQTLFLGRKGSGKSALFGQLPRLMATDEAPTVVVSLTPDQYAWALLREYQEQGIGSEQAHTNAWKFTLGIEIAARLVALDQKWGDEAAPSVTALRKFLTENYGTTPPGLQKTAASMVKGLKQVNLSAFGFGVGLQKEVNDQPVTPAVVRALLDLLSAPLAEARVLVALDRLDDSWDGSDAARSLLIGLLIASKDLNDKFGWRSNGPGVRIVVFLRSDIYDVLRFDENDKHRPTEEHILWTVDALKDMLQRRLPPGATVDELFDPGDMRGSISPFTYITKRTFLRPREVLQFVGECLRQAGDDAVEIKKDDVRKAEERYSGWKVKDLKQEYAKAFPEFDALLECLRQERHRYDSIIDLELLLESKKPQLVKTYGARRLAETLFDCSVLGVRLGDAGSTRFKSDDSDLAFPSSGAVYVHQSLHRGLKIREARTAAEESNTEGGTVQDRVTIELLGLMMAALPVQDLTFLGLSPTPVDVFRNETFTDCADALGIALVINEEGDHNNLARPNTLSRQRLVGDEAGYARVRASMLAVLSTHSLSVSDYEAGERLAKRR